MTGRRARVLHVAQSVETGVAHVVEDLVEAQLRRGWQVTVACPGGRLAELAAARGATVLGWQAERRPGGSVLREARALAGIVSAVRPDVVHLHSAKAGLVGRLVVRGRRPTVFTPHAWSWLAVTGPVRVAARTWERWGAGWADVIVCLSDAEAREAREAGVGTALRLVPNDVPVAALRAAVPPTREAARALLELPPDLPLVVCCARLAPQKGQDVLLEAWRGVTDRVPGARLVLVGDGPSRAALAARARSLTGVHLDGAADRRRALLWMRSATVVACPSRYEGMSLVPLEAAALGVPVVATDVEGMRGSLPDTARRLVAPGDPAGLAAALGDYLCDQALVRAGDRAATRWSSAATGPGSAATVLAIYDELTGGRFASRREVGA